MRAAYHYPSPTQPVPLIPEQAEIPTSQTVASECTPEPQQLFDKEWLNTEEAAAYLGLSVGALRNVTSEGKVPYYKFGRRNRYRSAELRHLLLSQKRGGKNGL